MNNQSEQPKGDYINLEYKTAQAGYPNLIYDTGFQVLYQEVEHGYYSCYIPSYNIAFTASKYEEIDELSEAIVNTFFQQWAANSDIESLLKKLGNLKFSEDGKTAIKKNLFDGSSPQKKHMDSLFKIPDNYSHYKTRQLFRNNKVAA